MTKRMKTKKAKPTAMQWIKCGIVIALYLLFLMWIKSWWGLVVVPFLFDAYITRFIPWTWWKTAKSAAVRNVMSWVDAIVFALVAVYFVHIYFFQNYTIPTSSLEKSLLVGDYLFVSKVSYGPRKPNTPLTMPLTQHTMPITGGKSYIEWPQWPYERVKGLGDVELNDIVVFNYPTGDTIVNNPRFAANDFYKMVSDISVELSRGQYPIVDSLTAAEERKAYEQFLAKGRKYIAAHPEVFGEVDWRPVDRRENYVKRCVGMPGQTIEIKDKVIYLDGVANKEPDNVQYSYYVATKRPISEKLRREAGISKEDLANHNANGTYYLLPLTQKAVEVLGRHTEIVDSITPIIEEHGQGLYPVNKHTGWSVDNYGPLWIPKRGETIALTLDNLPYYERPIAVYEGNDLEVHGEKIYINGTEANEYTFTMDYYWMQGDNRHNSLDSRFWGFVPEDHVVGKPILIWLSLDKDRGWFDGKIRWNRMFRMVEGYN